VTWAERLLADESAEVRAQALPCIESAIARMERHHNLRQVTILSVLQAMALDADGRRDEALGVLDETLRRAAPRGLVRTFVDRGPQAKELLDALARQNGPDDYRDMLRGAFPGEPASHLQQIPTDVRPQAGLSFRELEVLELLTERLSNKEIAARIAVTPEAVKKRVNKIYRKLGVADRYEAVAVALARGILSKRS
jgi:LuxR family maltose regulon positive regulatory protein